MLIHVSGLGVRGQIDDLKAILTDGESIHAVLTEVDTSVDPWRARAELRDAKTSAALQAKIDASRPSPSQIPASGEFELTIRHVKEYGAFLNNPWGAKILLHPSKLGLGYIADCTKLLRLGEPVKVRVLGKEVNGDEILLNVELSDEKYRKLIQGRQSEMQSA